MHRVLFVVYYFPPSGGPGVQRCLKFIRYLPRFGWEPLVLTVPETADFQVRDETLLGDVPSGLVIRRTRCPEPYGLYRALTRQRGAVSLDVSSQSAAERGPLRRLLRAARATILIPDGRMAWRPHAVRGGLDLRRAVGFDAIFSSGPPFTAHLIGRDLHRRTGCPWVADYRDPWTTATFYPARPRCARRIDERYESSCVHAATRTLVVGEEMAREFRRRHADVDPARFVVLPNGFDPADFADVPHAPPREFRITHAGSLFRGRAPEAFLAAIVDLMREHPGFAGRVRLCFAGRLDAEIRARLTRPPLDRVTELPGYLPHRESVALLRRSRLLLLAIGTDAQARSMVTGKIYEYLASGVPILALAPPDGDAARLIASTGTGWVFGPEDHAGVLAHLRSLWDQEHEREDDPSAVTAPRQFGCVRNEEEIRRYSRREQAHRLAEILQAACDGAATP
jgi:glycosyltransferase involved in cell wall biosynthesis